ncbi:peroxiredoxin [Brevibacillus choshinensis]|uniref:thioredoxin-dependent peroxiredoxin n=1 Tax=Brevibacillus choshinensis TaxID=54911 RepID=A0ABR5NBK7_BRECH|nr:redoxin domain-containing protein [Brevibacillus choshinensis]KQL48912.1 peroxiredoxin [Brevibacillus choshinensis]MED4585632.1 redoxin domain-containing protein [Brevibacillus choshinensis]MED4754128.1 redoxin domain-containing protein [Brevibacillus choshinensis]
MLQTGTKAPLFQANSTLGPIDLRDYVGKKNIVLIFYPGDDTPVCTKQLCAVQDNYADFEHVDTVVFGVNPAELEKKQSFAGKFGYRFPLLVDADQTIRQAYDVGKILGLFFQQRIVYIIGKNGTILYAKKGNPPVSELLQVLSK